MSDRSGPHASQGRDFGDSAGYGGGGSTRDYRDVLGEDAGRPPRPNPLDAVMTIPPRARRSAGRVPSLYSRPERDPSNELALAAGAMLAVAVGLLAWRHTQGRWTRRRMRMDGYSRESLARLQV